MRPFIIGVGGSHSGCGKTTVACHVLSKLRGWGAIKCTPTVLYSSVVESPEVLKNAGKDTGRFIGAGAAGVVWVQSTPHDLEETLGIAVGKLSHLEGVVLEGNSAIEVLKPDIVIFISKEPGRFKKSALAVLGMADLVVFESKPPPGIPAGARAYRLADREGYVKYVSEAIRSMRKG
jgi:molybdopterin-guanine dinucleotide biosynthesis protein